MLFRSKRRKSEEAAAALLATLRCIHGELAALRVAIADELIDMRALTHNTLAVAVGLEKFLEAERVLPENIIGLAWASCLAEADQVIEDWRAHRASA